MTKDMRHTVIFSAMAIAAAMSASTGRAATLSLDIDPPKITQSLPKNTTTQTSDTSKVTTTYSNSPSFLTGLDLSATGTTTSSTSSGDDHHRGTTYTTTVTANETEDFSYDQTKTITDFTRTENSHHQFGNWHVSGTPTTSTSALNGIGTKSDKSSFSGQSGTVEIDYDFSLNPGKNPVLTLLDSTGIGGLTVSLESYGKVLETWVSNGSVLLPTTLGNFVGDDNSDDKYHIAVTATDFGNGSHLDIGVGVSPVPLPGALTLFAPAIIGFGAWGRRRRSRQSAA
jgi:hypothetical protein